MPEPIDDLLDIKDPPPGGLRRLRIALDPAERPAVRRSATAWLLVVPAAALAAALWWFAAPPSRPPPPEPAPLAGADDPIVQAMRGSRDLARHPMTIDGEPVDAHISADGRVLILRGPR